MNIPGKFFLKISILLAASCLIFIITFASEHQLNLSAKRLNYSEDKKQVTLIGNVRISIKNIVLTGNWATFNTKTGTGKLLGEVFLSQPGTKIKADRMNVNYFKQQAELQGNVKIQTTENIAGLSKSYSSSSPDTPATLTCDNLHYDWTQRIGKATGNVRIIQKDRRAFASKAFYNANLEIITLEGGVSFEEGSNDWIKCPKAIVNLKQGTFFAVGGVTGNFLVKEEETKDGKYSKLNLLPDKLPLQILPFEEKKTPD